MALNDISSILGIYSGYFHDGYIHEIIHENNSIIMSIESAGLLREWDWDRTSLPLSKRATIAGKLHIEHIKNIKQNGENVHVPLRMIYKYADLYDIKIRGNKLTFLVTWEQSVPVKVSTDMITIEIEAEKFYWENIPTFFDAYWDGDE